MMAYQNRVPVNDDLLDQAACSVLSMANLRRDEPIRVLAEAAVKDIFCFCVTDGPDAVEGHLSSIHAAVIDEVVARTRRLEAGAGRSAPPIGGSTKQPTSPSPRATHLPGFMPIEAISPAGVGDMP